MTDISNTMYEIEKLDRLQHRDQWVNRIHPLVKVLLTVIYIAVTVSFSKYQLVALLPMCVYPLFVFINGELSFGDCLRRMRIILPVVCMVGIFNPFFDNAVVIHIGNLPISGGVLSMLSLMLKGVLTVLAAYLLIATTGIEEICYALRRIHIPKMIVTVILLIYRYIFILLQEAERIMTAYRLRAPGQKGIHYKTWGPLVGQLLLRSMDRAEHVYESMCIRGFQGEYQDVREKGWRWQDITYLIVWLAIFVVVRYTSLISWIGSLFL